MSAHGWEGKDGSATALIVTPEGQVMLWTNLGEWLELSADGDPVSEAANLADAMGLQRMHPQRLATLLSVQVPEL